MSTQLLEPPVRYWRCPSCQRTDRTQRSDPHTQMHACVGLGGLNAPLVEVLHRDDRPDARHVVLEREDYAADADRVMSVRTDHGDGSNDTTVFPQTARLAFASGNPSVGVAARPGVAGVRGEARMHHEFRDSTVARMADVASRWGAQMAWTTSDVFAFSVLQVGKNTVNYNSDSYKVALYASNTMTPDRTVTTAALTEYNGAASQWVTANESSGTGYTAGGTAVTPVTWTQSSNVVTFTSSGSPQWTGATITAYGCLVYDTTVNNEGLSFNYFGGQQVTTVGTFTISWNASGIATFTC